MQFFYDSAEASASFVKIVEANALVDWLRIFVTLVDWCMPYFPRELLTKS